MKYYALLNVLYGHSNTMGKVPEIRFKYPPQVGREKEIFDKVIKVIEEYNFQTSFSWALVDGENFSKYCEAVKTLIPDSEVIKKPVLVMHGAVDFYVCMRLKGFQLKDKEELLDKLQTIDIPLSKKFLSFSRSTMREINLMMGIEPTEEELRAEKRELLSKNLSFYTEVDS